MTILVCALKLPAVRHLALKKVMALVHQASYWMLVKKKGMFLGGVSWLYNPVTFHYHL